MLLKCFSSIVIIHSNLVEGAATTVEPLVTALSEEIVMGSDLSWAASDSSDEDDIPGPPLRLRRQEAIERYPQEGTRGPRETHGAVSSLDELWGTTVAISAVSLSIEEDVQFDLVACKRNVVYSVKPDTRNILYRCLPSISIYTYCYFLVAMSLTVHLAFTTLPPSEIADNDRGQRPFAF